MLISWLNWIMWCIRLTIVCIAYVTFDFSYYVSEAPYKASIVHAQQVQVNLDDCLRYP